MGKIKRIIGITLTCVMILGLAACGKKSKTDSTVVTKKYDKNCIYSVEVIDAQGVEGHLRDMTQCEGRIVSLFVDIWLDESNMDEDANPFDAVTKNADDIVLKEGTDEEAASNEDITAGEDATPNEDAENMEADAEFDAENYDASGSYTASFVVYDMSGKKENVVVKKYDTSDADISGFWVDKDLNVYYVMDFYARPDESRDRFHLFKCDKNGNELWETPLGENVDSDGWYYARLSGIYDDEIYISTNLGLDKFNPADGTLIKGYQSQEWGEGSGNIYILRDNSAVSTFYNGMESADIMSVDLNTMTKKEKIQVPFDPGMMDFSVGKTCDFIISDNRGVYTCNIGDTEYTKIMDYVDSDFPAAYLRNITQVSEDSFWSWWYDDIEDEDKFGIFTKVKPEDIPDKETITVGMAYLDYEIRKAAVEFNRNNSQYRIILKDYSDQGGDGFDYDKMLEQMNNDIIGGNVPDIVLIDESLPMKSYVQKGVFTDLYPLMDNDSTYNRDFFMPNVLKALETDGKLYEITPSFYISTVAAKTEVVGNRDTFTMDDLIAMMKAQDPSVMDFGKLTKSEFMYQAIRYNMGKFVDWETGKVSFDSDEFIKILEYTDKYQMEYSSEDETYWDGYESMYAEGRALFDCTSISDFNRFITLKQGTFGNADITFVGFPTDTGKGNYINSYMTFAISEKSANKEAAWEFLKSFFNEEAQEEQGCFAISVKAVEEQLERAKKLPSYLDDDGNLVEFHDTYWMYDTEIELNPLTDEEAKAAYDFVKSVDTFGESDQKIIEIVNEEVESYYNNQKSAQDVAKVIQSRVQIYVNENR